MLLKKKKKKKIPQHLAFLPKVSETNLLETLRDRK